MKRVSTNDIPELKEFENKRKRYFEILTILEPLEKELKEKYSLELSLKKIKNK